MPLFETKLAPIIYTADGRKNDICSNTEVYSTGAPFIKG